MHTEDTRPCACCRKRLPARDLERREGRLLCGDCFWRCRGGRHVDASRAPAVSVADRRDRTGAHRWGRDGR